MNKTRQQRKFERLKIPVAAKVHVLTLDGKKIGGLMVLGRGGFRVHSQQEFHPGDVHTLIIEDQSEGIRRQVRAVVRNRLNGAIGFEFENLDPDAAVEMGVIIGKYYSATHTAGQS